MTCRRQLGLIVLVKQGSESSVTPMTVSVCRVFSIPRARLSRSLEQASLFRIPEMALRGYKKRIITRFWETAHLGQNVGLREG